MAFVSLLSKHGLTLLCVARNPDSRLRDIADFVGVTERSAHALVSDLRKAGYLEHQRIGVRNRYELHGEAPLPDPGLDGRRLGELLGLLGANPGTRGALRGRSPAEPRARERRQQDRTKRERSG